MFVHAPGTIGHDSVEDSLTALELACYKVSSLHGVCLWAFIHLYAAVAAVAATVCCLNVKICVYNCIFDLYLLIMQCHARRSSTC